jgi:uncharacterized OB-fold protein
MSGLSAAFPPDLARIETDVFTVPFWEAAQEQRLMFPACESCGRFRWPPTPVCPGCYYPIIRWVQVRGEAELYSYTILGRVRDSPGLLLIPVVAEIPDAPGIRFVSTLVDADPAKVRIGASLTVSFVPTGADWLWPAFRLAHAVIGPILPQG